MAVTFICGHLHPDTDSIVSALACEELFVQQGEHVLAVRGGPLNPETAWVLERFKTQEPPEIRDVRMQLRDLAYDRLDPVPGDTPLWEAWERIASSSNQSLPVIDRERRLIGVITAGDFAKIVYNTNISQPREVDGPRLIKTLNGRCSGDIPELMTIPMAWSGRSNQPIQEGSLVFAELLVEEQIERAIQAKAIGFCLCYMSEEEGEFMRRKWEARFNEENLLLITTPLDPFTALRRAMLCLSVSAVLKDNPIISFHESDAVDEVRPAMLNSRFRAYPVLDSRNRVLGLVSRYHLLQPTKKKVILVDHNERSQAVRGLDQAEVMGIIDHHRLGDIQTSHPILFRNETVGCTSTILAKMFKEQGLLPAKRTAGLMICAILSDTVQFKSPTCTRQDIEAAQWLAEIAEEDIEALGQEMFSLGHRVPGETASDLLFMDFKEFYFGEVKVGVGQISLFNLDGMEKLLEQMSGEMAHILPLQRFDLLLFMATDITDEGTWLYYAGSHIKELGDAFDMELSEKQGHFFLPGVMSRKKQLIPALGGTFN